MMNLYFPVAESCDFSGVATVQVWEKKGITLIYQTGKGAEKNETGKNSFTEGNGPDISVNKAPRQRLRVFKGNGRFWL